MSNIPVYYFALREDLKEDKRFLPQKAEPLATGYDVRAAMPDKKDLILRPGQHFKIPLGFRSLPPTGWWYQLHPRSSTFAKKYIHCLIGVVDESWEGETLLAGQYLPDVNSMGKDLTIKFGDPIGQIVPVQRQEMDVCEFSNKEMDHAYEFRNEGVQIIRGKGGFGSTG